MQPRGQLWFALENLLKDFKACSGLEEAAALKIVVAVLSNMLADQQADLERVSAPPPPA